MTKPDLTPKLLGLAGLAIVVLVAAIGWFALVSPQRSKADDLNQQIAETQTNIATEKATPLPTKASGKGKGKQSPTEMLAAALPTSVQMPSLLRQVQRLAAESNVSLQSFTPSAPVPGAGYESIPISLSVVGRYATIKQFLHLLRTQAGLVNGQVRASGRLFGVQTVSLAPGGTGLPDLSASIGLNAYLFQAPPPTVPTTTTTTTTTTTSTAQTAAGATP